MNGILLVNKPTGWTSFDVVAKIRAVCSVQERKKVKVGHTGTLDPLAEGLLIILIGDYCKKAQEYSKLSKSYSCAIKLGQISTTDDQEGEKVTISNKKPSLVEINKVLKTFVGKTEQTPPNFSAIKIDGKRAYKLAREGKEVDIKPKTVEIYSISNVKYSYPNLLFDAEVSSGTYIRALARDIGQKLKTGAYMINLRRISIDKYSVNNAITPVDINIDTIKIHLLTG